MTETTSYTKTGSSFKSWFRGVAATAMLGLLTWGGSTLWEVHGTINSINEKITSVQDQDTRRRQSEQTQWRLLQEHTRDVARLKAQIETLRYVQTAVVLPELQNPIPRRITFQVVGDAPTPVAEKPKPKVKPRFDFKELERKLQQIEKSDVYGQRSGANKNLRDFQQDQIQQQQQQQRPQGK